MEQWYVWLAIIIILAVLEATTINLTTIWFVISGLAALVLSFFVDNYIIQFGVFVILGVVLLVTTRPLLERILKQRKEDTNIGRIVGTRGIVTQKITKNETGEVKVDGKIWTAYADKAIKESSLVKILEISGAKIKVEKIEEEEK